jgi:hypothetical protein
MDAHAQAQWATAQPRIQRSWFRFPVKMPFIGAFQCYCLWLTLFASCHPIMSMYVHKLVSKDSIKLFLKLFKSSMHTYTSLMFLPGELTNENNCRMAGLIERSHLSEASSSIDFKFQTCYLVKNLIRSTIYVHKKGVQSSPLAPPLFLDA